MNVKYNAPAVLTFAFISAGVLILSLTVTPSLTKTWFLVPGKDSFSVMEISNWVSIITHIFGHDSWNHLVSNFAYILLIGPILEEYYGSFALFIMILITGIITGLLNILFFSTGLLGASGVVFMMILLASFTNFSKGEIPLTFILILALYLGRELFNTFTDNNISQFAHIVGGFCGSLFGFIRPRPY
ncbi:MAG: rhomboid family intramembrane serine protease [Treponema sp.]|jgi:membrane associated rhomboid family serine protease|nr:rhomboid family intramembrane serine protease [Treponema sp.]